MYFFAVGGDIPKASATFRIVFLPGLSQYSWIWRIRVCFFYVTVPGRGIVPMKGRVFYCHMSFLCCPGCGRRVVIMQGIKKCIIRLFYLWDLFRFLVQYVPVPDKNFCRQFLFEDIFQMFQKVLEQVETVSHLHAVREYRADGGSVCAGPVPCNQTYFLMALQPVFQRFPSRPSSSAIRWWSFKS